MPLSECGMPWRGGASALAAMRQSRAASGVERAAGSGACAHREAAAGKAFQTHPRARHRVHSPEALGGDHGHARCLAAECALSARSHAIPLRRSGRGCQLPAAARERIALCIHHVVRRAGPLRRLGRDSARGRGRARAAACPRGCYWLYEYIQRCNHAGRRDRCSGQRASAASLGCAVLPHAVGRTAASRDHCWRSVVRGTAHHAARA
mmetsp:Transcript_15499/g.64354  ORF Transcript_15499/g.64354 Transcript_15499/m.64354 type:complete len:208 (+) Transcript_15499:2825-3448(+)